MASTNENLTTPRSPTEDSPAHLDVHQTERFSSLWPARPCLPERFEAERDELPDLLRQVEMALPAVVPGVAQAWLERILEQLRIIRQSLGEHSGGAGIPDRFTADIDLPSPALVRRSQKLSREHAELVVQIRMLLVLIEHEGGADNTSQFNLIRRRVELLLKSLRQHEVLETDLLHESLCTDIGIGD